MLFLFFCGLQVIDYQNDLAKALTMPNIRFMKNSLKTSWNEVDEPTIENHWQKAGQGISQDGLIVYKKLYITIHFI